ncbi:MAG: DUF6428 family protein [Bacteroidota bacterium]
MTLSAVKDYLQEQEKLLFYLPDGTTVPAHFHVTEVGVIHKHFIDCGGKERQETKANFQLWQANDYDHRLHPEKLVHIIELSQERLGMGDLEVEVEYQGSTIGKYGLAVGANGLELTTTHTDCLAREGCGVPAAVKSLDLSNMVTTAGACTPGGGCC